MNTPTKHKLNAALAFIFLAITLFFVGYIIKNNPDVSDVYSNKIKNGLEKIGPLFGWHKEDHIPSALITEFGTTTEISIIDENTATTTAPEFPTDIATTTIYPENLVQVNDPKLSPESIWASIYLGQMSLTQDDLKPDIRYVREWQQTGGFTRDLKQGSKGTDVKLMQYMLSLLDAGFDRSSVTGTFGPQTKTAVANFQTKLNITPTGVFSDELRFFFDSLYFKDLCPDALPDQDKSLENVSRRTSVPLDYIPSDLMRLPKTVRTVGVMCLSREPIMKLDELFQAAKNEGQELAVFSAYRSSNTQRLLTAYYLETMGEAGLAGIAEAGHSEHQLGTTVDMSGKSLKYAGPSDYFGNTPEGKWLAANSYKYGYIMSYPAGKQAETGYIYEPWHFRYVGVDIAKQIFDEKMTIQQYLGQKSTAI